MINPRKYYTITDLLKLAKEGFFPIKSRTTIMRLIQSGKLPVANTSSGGKRTYFIKGEDLLAFLDSSGSYEIEDNK